MTMGTPCRHCGEQYERIGTHWRYNESHRPALTAHQIEVITGLLMGDGHLNRSEQNPRLRVSCIEEGYLKYLDTEIFPVLGNGVSLDKKASELAERNRQRSGIFETVNEEEYHDTYWWGTCAHPELSKFNHWYNTKKEFPENLSLSPTKLKHWYIGDGTLDNRWNPRILLAASNEVGNRDKLRTYFTCEGLPAPRFSKSERESGGMRLNMMWGHQNSMEILRYIGEPLPGYEYKWPDRYK